MASSPLSPLSPITPGREVIFESYLHKTPPLDKLFVVSTFRFSVSVARDPMRELTRTLFARSGSLCTCVCILPIHVHVVVLYRTCSLNDIIVPSTVKITTSSLLFIRCSSQKWKKRWFVLSRNDPVSLAVCHILDYTITIILFVSV